MAFYCRDYGAYICGVFDMNIDECDVFTVCFFACVIIACLAVLNG